ncbi:hypothetical protein M3Y98_00750200 [Aphelenchoides besseyi]|nr:hypothetical protein M3Y98_00750200 [Aphelenchoides besseyi]
MNSEKQLRTPDFRLGCCFGVVFEISSGTKAEPKMETARHRKLIAVIGDEKTVVDYVSVAQSERKTQLSNFYITDTSTGQSEIEDAFRSFLLREDIAIVLVAESVADRLRSAINQHTAGFPFVIERPTSTGKPYEDADLFKQSLELLDRFQLPIYDLICSLVLNCPPGRQREYINLLFEYLKRVNPQSFDVCALTVWTALTLFILPTRLNISSTSNDEVFEAFEQHLKSIGQSEPEASDGVKKNIWENRQLFASILLFYAISVQCTVGTRRGKLNLLDPLGEAVDMRAFHFIAMATRQIDNFHSYTRSIEVIDCFLKYFIIYCQGKLQEMFSISEEELEKLEMELEQNGTIGTQHDFSMHFKVFLFLIQRLYDEDENEQLVQYSRQFFMPEYVSSKTESGIIAFQDHLGQFLRSGTAISLPSLYVDYVVMLTALCKTHTAANFLFRLFNSTREQLYDWASLFSTLRQYAQVFRRRQNSLMNNAQGYVATPQKMRKQDKLGTMAWIRLAAAIAKYDSDARRYFVLGNHFNAVDTLISALTSSMPRRLKGEIYKFLATLAMDENSAGILWSMLIRERVCELGDEVEGKLNGILPNEFDEKETVKRSYNATFGALHLIRALFSRRHLPDSRVLVAYVHFVNKSIICQYDQRGYTQEQQMWELLSVGVDCVFQLLRRFHISPMSVSRRGPHIVRGLIECCKNLDYVMTILERGEHTFDFGIAEARTNASKILLRLVAHVSIVHPTLRASLRSTTEAASIFVPALKTLMLTPLPSAPQSNYVQLLNMELAKQRTIFQIFFLPHTYYVIRILRKLATKPSAEVHDALLQTFELNAGAMRCIFARLLSIHSHEIEVSDQDVIPFDLHNVTTARLRGEIARELLELFYEIMETSAGRPNLTYLLFGYELSNWRLTKQISLDENNKSLTCMESLIDLVDSLVYNKEPHKTSYAVLYEPALRLLSKLCAVGSISCEPTLRFLRNSSNLIYNLTQSPIFQDAHSDATVNDFNGSTTFMIEQSKNALDAASDHEADIIDRVPVHLETFRRQIRGLILELIAVDFSVAMSSNHVRLPADYMNVLLSVQDKTEKETTTIERAQTTTPNRAILWSLLYNSLSASLDVHTPTYESFDMTRVEEVLKLCLRQDSSGVEVYDVERVHFVLNEELSSILNTDVTDIKKEANEILLYCVRYNAQLRLEGSCLQVLSGWVAFVNAIVHFAPLPFLDLTTQEAFLNDALLVLKEYVETVTMNEEVLGGVSNCLFGIIRRLVQFACLKWDTEHERKVALGTLMHVLVRCLTLPGYNRYTRFKMDIYGAMLCVMEACSEPTVESDRAAIEHYRQTGNIQRQRDGNLAEASLKPATLIDSTISTKTLGAHTLESLLNQRADVHRYWTALFRENAYELVQSCAVDIEYAPLGHKLLAIVCLAEMVREDRDAPTSVVIQQIARAQLVKAILDTLPSVVDVDFTKVQHDQTAAFQMLQTCLSLFIRIATSRGGFALLSDSQTLPRLNKLSVWKTAPERLVETFELLGSLMK